MIKLFFVIILITRILSAQIKEISFPENFKSDGHFFVEYDQLLSDVFIVKFNKPVLPSNFKQNIKIEDISPKYENLLKLLNELESLSGNISITKTFKNFEVNDIYKTNKRTGAQIQLKDLSQVYQIKLNKPLNVNETIKKLQNIPEVEYAHQAISVVKNISINDPIYITPGQWNLNVIQAENAWDFTHGSSEISIGIIDGGIYFDHEDLIGKQKYSDNIITEPHGTWVAGVAGANTNNDLGISSIGFNCKINSINPDSSSIANAIFVSSLYSDIINMSFVTASVVTREDLVEVGCDYPDKWEGSLMPYNYPEIEDAITNAILQGVICVASAGNASENLNYGPHPEICDFWKIPKTVFPAAYNNVISVSATELNNGEEFVDEWNYGSFVDLAAPGKNIWTTDYPGGYLQVSGTSFSAPLVSGVISLLLSLNPNLTLQQVQDYLMNSTDKIDEIRYPYNDNGWNQFLGYGRINAFKAVKRPSAPQNLSYVNNMGHPRLTWSASQDWDVIKYEIFRDLGEGFNKIAEVNSNISYYDDYDVIIGSKNLNSAFYYIKAVDITNQSSEPSVTIRIKFSGLQKENFFIEDLTNEFDLFPNYPNPFNPSTIIKFSIPNDELVILKLFNILGQEVETILNLIKPAGLHTINFNANELSAGVYILTMQAGTFFKTQKIIIEK